MREEYLACLFVRQADAGGFGNLKYIIINDYLRGGPDSPKNFRAAVTLFKHYQPTIAKRQSQNRAAAEPSNNDLAFTHPWKEEGSRADSRACYSCGSFGHLMRDCQITKNEDKIAIFTKGDAAWQYVLISYVLPYVGSTIAIEWLAELQRTSARICM